MNLIILLIIFIWGWVEISAFIVIGSEVGVLLTILGVAIAGGLHWNMDDAASA